MGVMAQEIPPIQKYSPKEYKAENQNWSISQSNNSFIYVANNGGLLQFDGARWKLHALNKNSTVRSVSVVNYRIFTGSYMDFGYWKNDEFGNLIYTSLVKTLNITLLEDEEFWKIEELDGWLFFQSFSRIYLINIENNTYRIIESEVPIAKMFKVDNTIFFQKEKLGVFKLVSNKVKLVSDDELIRDTELVNIFKINNQFVYLTEENGFYKSTQGKLEIWDTELYSKYNNLSVYRAIQLSNQSIAIGTISEGLIILNPDGSVENSININNGLSNNTVLSIFEDHYNHIWLGLDNGINCINTTSIYKSYEDLVSNLGTVYTSIMYNNTIFLGTNQGLFYKKRNSKERFKVVEGTSGQVWMLKEIEGQLFCGHDDGTLIIKGSKILRVIDNLEGTWDFHKLKNTDNLILQGNYRGLSVLEKKNSVWKYRNKIEGIDLSCRFFYQMDSTIFVNHEFKGLFKLQLDSNFNKVKSIEKINSIDKGVGASILGLADNFYYSSSKGVFKYNDKTGFVYDEEFSGLLNDAKKQSTLLPINGLSNTLWCYGDNKIIVVTPSSVSAKPKVVEYPFANEIRDAVAGFENMTKITEYEYLLGQTNGYFILNFNQEVAPIEYKISINSVSANKINEPKVKLITNKSSKLESKQNNIQFKFSIPNYNNLIRTNYQYQLEGWTNKWSSWQENATQFYENLPYGTYTFKVRGKVGNTLTSNSAVYEFTIARPWYFSNVLIVIYILSLFFIFTAIHYVYKNYYNRQKEQVLKQSKRDLELKELESKQIQTQLKNEKLKLDIDNKSRELAISTMSLIRKNEFLNTVKEKLLNVDKIDYINNVIQLIDKNINSNDDWKLFKEAFNNADKDFLNKIKKSHPDLTANDLKLCAYLRLNLSSKEIAPLLNISIKSVEVKRYRLRKKMNLPHKTSLTKYILEI